MSDRSLDATPSVVAEVAEYPQASIRELAIGLMAADMLLTDFIEAEASVVWTRRLFDSCDTDPLWANGRHDGDCTNQPMTCTRCVVEEWEAKARELAIAEGFELPLSNTTAFATADDSEEGLR